MIQERNSVENKRGGKNTMMIKADIHIEDNDTERNSAKNKMKTNTRMRLREKYTDRGDPV